MMANAVEAVGPVDAVMLLLLSSFSEDSRREMFDM